MADPRIYHDGKTGKITRTEPPELMGHIKQLGNTSLYVFPTALIDTTRGFRLVSVQVSAENRVPNPTR